jgi:hypothetical protein
MYFFYIWDIHSANPSQISRLDRLAADTKLINNIADGRSDSGGASGMNSYLLMIRQAAGTLEVCEFTSGPLHLLMVRFLDLRISEN